MNSPLRGGQQQDLRQRELLIFQLQYRLFIALVCGRPAAQSSHLRSHGFPLLFIVQAARGARGGDVPVSPGGDGAPPQRLHPVRRRPRLRRQQVAVQPRVPRRAARRGHHQPRHARAQVTTNK